MTGEIKVTISEAGEVEIDMTGGVGRRDPRSA